MTRGARAGGDPRPPAGAGPPRDAGGQVRPILEDDGSRDGPLGLRLLLAGLVGLVGIGTVLALRAGGPRPATVPLLVREQLGASGISNPVAAVLLNFRGYDTLLEIAVLLTAMAGVWSLDRGSRQFGRPGDESRSQPVLGSLIHFAVPVAFLTAVYLTWAGSSRPGGAFQAASLLAGTGVLLTVSGLLRPPTAASATVRAIAAGGLAAFVFVGIGVLPWTGHFLAYPEGWNYPLILGIEAVLTVSIAVVLVELFVDVPAVPDPDPSLESVDPSGDPLGRALRSDPGRAGPGDPPGPAPAGPGTDPPGPEGTG